MTLLDIETFLAVVKYGNLSTAAQNLYITQPALTRRIQLMEQELGYPLITRRKGYRTVQLTDQGAEFYHIAWKWQQLWEETNSISIFSGKELLSVAAIYSVSHPFLSRIYPDFLDSGFQLRHYNVLSEEVYQYMERGLYDLAFIEQQDFTCGSPQGVLTKPAFSEVFVAASYAELPTSDGLLDVSALPREREVYVPWNSEFKNWHASRFKEQIPPLVVLEDVSIMGCFLKEDNWIIVPYAVGGLLKASGANIYSIQNGPPDRIIYYAARMNAKRRSANALLSLLDHCLRTFPPEKIRSFLPAEL